MSNDPDGDFGVDAKYGITQNLTADLTYNTDFAQVEADEQQVNLTRFSLFFPEKRDFFLENQGIFTFGTTRPAGGNGDASDVPVLFYSRRIGLANGPRGADLGRRPRHRPRRPLQLGVIEHADTEDDRAAAAPSTNFSVRPGEARHPAPEQHRRCSLRRGPIAQTVRRARTRPTASTARSRSSATWPFNTYWRQDPVRRARQATTPATAAQMDYAGDRYGVQLERLIVDTNFNPEVGFLRRDRHAQELRRWLRFSPRPKAIKSMRKFSGIGQFTYMEDAPGA